MTFNEIPGKNVTYDDFKSNKKQSLSLFSDSIFLNGTSILVFAKLAVFHSI